MKRKLTNKALTTLGLMCFLFVMMPAAAFSWNQATHAYIADRLGAPVGYDNLDEMWGSVTPDMFNFVFDPALCPGWIADQTQGTYAETFMKVWTAAGTNAEKALPMGSSATTSNGEPILSHIPLVRRAGRTTDTSS